MQLLPDGAEVGVKPDAFLQEDKSGIDVSSSHNVICYVTKLLIKTCKNRLPLKGTPKVLILRF